MHKHPHALRTALFVSIASLAVAGSDALAGPAATYSVFTGTYSGNHDSGTVTIALGTDGAALCMFASGSTKSPLIDPFVMNAFAAGASINTGFGGIGFSCASSVDALTFGHQVPLIAAVARQVFPPAGTASQYPDTSFSGTWFNDVGDKGTFQVAYSEADSHSGQ